MNEMTHRKGLAALRRALEDVDRILILTHVNPDGDAVGSVLALRGILESIGKHASVVIPDTITRKYQFLVDKPVLKPDSPELESLEAEERFQMLIFVDASERERAGNVLDHLDRWMSENALEVNIDHHVSNDNFGDIAIIDPDRASAAELVLQLAETLDVDISPVIAGQLFAAVLTDTGRFQFGNTDSNSLSAAAQLVTAGADPSLIAQRIYLERPAPFYQLLGNLLSSIELYHDGRTCLMTMTSDLIDTYFPNGRMDSEGIVDFTIQVEGVEVGVFIRQTGENAFRASLRSRSEVDVRMIVETFGGGGHEKAAGCGLEGSLSDVRERIITEVEKWLK
jgi:phosphoesterase RecJ-like protein